MSRFPHTPFDAELIAVIQNLSKPLIQEPTGLASRLHRLPNLRVVLFDIYGTLFLSGSGDIGVSRKSNITTAFRDALETAGISLEDKRLDSAHARFYELIEASHAQSRAEGIACPEVDIISIWRILGAECVKDRGSNAALSEMSLHRLAVEYECRQNPVWPMPGMPEFIQDLRDAGLLLGIVSNAQFYTPLLFPALLDVTLDALGFDPDLCSWSWLSREAKPSARLIQPILAHLNHQGIEPHEVAVVGNDMLNDIQMAAQVGCQTALFAGDRRSLRLREDHPDCTNMPADAVITELPQLLDCLALQD